MDVTTDALTPDASLDITGWKKAVGGIFAVLLALLFFISGGWKLTDPFLWSQVVGQFKVPSEIGLPLAIAVGVGETFCAALILVPRFRRWGSILMSVILVGFMLYFAVNYGALAGKDCSCFPIVKRTVGPGFFIGDSIMLACAILAGWWARRPYGVRDALIILAAICVFAGVSFGVNETRESGVRAPSSVTVDGKPYSLEQGHIFVFFYDPSCPHCDAAARRMAKLDWKDTTVLAVPINNPQWAASFLHDTGLKALTSDDAKPLRDVFKFVNAPYGVALNRGREKTAVGNFDESEPARTLRAIGYVR
jgi:uncharacterized membrane protein YphA (DoxX/SURF4 family)